MIPCNICNLKIIDVRSYISHLKNRHSLKHYGNFSCPSCKNSFHRMNKFHSHLILCYSIPKQTEKSSNENNSNFKNVPFPIQSPSEQTQNSEREKETENEMEEHFSQEEYSQKTESLTDVEEKAKATVLKFALTLHAKPNLTRSDVFYIQSLVVQLLFTSILNSLQIMCLQTKACSKVDDFLKVVKIFIKCMQEIGSEHLLTKELENRDLYKNLDNKDSEFVINNEVGVIFKKGVSAFGQLTTTGMLLPICFQIKQFLSRNNRINEIFDNLKKYSSPSDVISHIFQGTTWKKIRSYFPSDSIVIPIGLYTDGVQYNNQTGPHQNSSDMLYYFYPGLKDPLHKTNIHVASIINSKNIKEYGNGRCLAPLVRELFRLCTDGVDLVFNGKVINVKIVVCQIIGDNLALNAILEYILGFSKGKYYCRICRLSRTEAEQVCEEIVSELRNKENYEADLLTNNEKLTGITNDCIFNTLPYFHCTMNLSLDLMHDFFEGIFKYDICQILLYFINKGVISLKELNDRINCFQYGSEEVRYIPNILEKKNLGQFNLKMTAREAWQFLYLLPILIGDKIDEGDEVWKLLLILMKIIEICLGSYFDLSLLNHLTQLIKEHNILYQRFFGSLKPKMHLITHLPTSIKAMGPPRNYMCFRMEQYHRFFKIYAHCTPNRKNIPKTFSKKYALYYAHLLFENKIALEIETEKELQSSYPLFLAENEKCFKKINYRGTDYIAGMFLPLMESCLYNLYEILENFVSPINIHLVCKKVAMLTYNSHYESFTLNRNCEAEIKRIQIQNFKSVPLYIYKINSNEEVIRPKIFFNQI